MNKTIIAVVIIAAVLLGGYFLFKMVYKTPSSAPQTSNQQTAPQGIRY